MKIERFEDIVRPGNLSRCEEKKRGQERVGNISPRELAFDIDGVLADTFRVFVETARNQYHVQVAYEDITEYDFRKVIDIDIEIARDIIERILDHPIQMGIRPIEGAVEVLRLLAGEGPILLVTARPGRSAIYEWVLQHLQGVDSNLIRLEATGTHEEKVPILLKHGIRYFVEDRLDTCYLLATAQVTPIVFEQPWNQKPHPFIRVRSWAEIEQMIAWSGSTYAKGCLRDASQKKS
ncbi:MAG: haloacid dehalogenase [Deltaproteobacteria bacterium]|nr:haloacid dehalogenase [Deltaproteobacteria bacterium]